MRGHLINEKARALLSKSLGERIKYVRADVFVPYTAATEAMNALEELLEFDQGEVSRMPCLLLIGPQGSGKSTLVRRFAEMHPVEPNPDGPYAKAEVLLLEARQNASESRLYREFRRVLNPQKVVDKLNPELARKRLDERFNDTGWDLIKKVGLKVPIIDEFHNLIVNMPQFAKEKEPIANTRALNDVKSLHNEYRLSIVGAGIESAQKVVEADPQLASRFFPIKLPRWKYDKDFTTFLAGLEAHLPFPEPSNLYGEARSKDIHRLLSKKSLPTTKEIRELVRKSATVALKRGASRVTRDDLFKGMKASS